jgi:hypothetical protein
MRRLNKVLAVTALMVLLMATTVSPAFAATNPPGRGYGSDANTNYKWCGDPKKCDETWGYACGAVRNEKKESAYAC